MIENRFQVRAHTVRGGIRGKENLDEFTAGPLTSAQHPHANKITYFKALRKAINELLTNERTNEPKRSQTGENVCQDGQVDRECLLCKRISTRTHTVRGGVRGKQNINWVLIWSKLYC